MLGEGAMANVYLVEDKNNQKFAVKELKEEFSSDRNRRIRFHNEALIIKNYNHPNIIRVYDIAKKMEFRNNRGSYKNFAYVLEYCPGQSLKDYLGTKPDRILSYQEINSFFSRLFDALEYCHQRQVFHRDLKPANILLKKHGEKLIPLLTDFGVAKIYDPKITGGEDLTKEVTLLGAPAYMSPEQITNPSEVTAKSDLYSMGIILYEAVTGERPFKGSRMELIQQQMTSTPIKPSLIRKGLDPSLERLIMRLLEKDPKKRPASCSEAKALLEQTTTEIIRKPLINRDSLVYKSEIHCMISQAENGRIVKRGKTVGMPVNIGREFSNLRTNIENSKSFTVKTNSQNILQRHCEIYKMQDEKFFIKELTGQKMFVNVAAIKNDSFPLDQKVNRIRLPNGTWLEISIKKVEKLNPVFIFGLIGLILIIVTIILLIVISER